MAAVTDLDTSDFSMVRCAADVLALSVHESIRGLAPYHASGFAHYLSAALEPPAEFRTIFVRLVVKNGTLVGAADWRILPDKLFLNGIAVAEAARGMGVGRQLMLDGIRISKELNLTRLGLDVVVENAVAMSFYRRLGFVVISEMKWCDISPSADADTTSSAMALDWPSFRAHLAAYGFGDLTVRNESAGLGRVRQIGGNLRVDAVMHRPWAVAYSKLLGTTRLFRAIPEGIEEEGVTFSRSARMQLEA